MLQCSACDSVSALQSAPFAQIFATWQHTCLVFGGCGFRGSPLPSQGHSTLGNSPGSHSSWKIWKTNGQFLFPFALLVSKCRQIVFQFKPWSVVRDFILTNACPNVSQISHANASPISLWIKSPLWKNKGVLKEKYKNSLGYCKIFWLVKIIVDLIESMQ